MRVKCLIDSCQFALIRRRSPAPAFSAVCSGGPEKIRYGPNVTDD